MPVPRVRRPPVPPRLSVPTRPRPQPWGHDGPTRAPHARQPFSGHRAHPCATRPPPPTSLPYCPERLHPCPARATPRLSTRRIAQTGPARNPQGVRSAAATNRTHHIAGTLARTNEPRISVLKARGPSARRSQLRCVTQPPREPRLHPPLARVITCFPPPAECVLPERSHASTPTRTPTTHPLRTRPHAPPPPSRCTSQHPAGLQNCRLAIEPRNSSSTQAGSSSRGVWPFACCKARAIPV